MLSAAAKSQVGGLGVDAIVLNSSAVIDGNSAVIVKYLSSYSRRSRINVTI
jgi:hypothetical protein